MSVVIRASGSANEAEVDSNGNLLVVPGYAPAPSAGGFYSVSGGTSAVVAASLAANTTLMAMRFAPASARKAYISRFRVLIGVATVGTSALVAGSLALQRFNTATPTAGTARTVNALDPLSTTTDMTDVRDSNAALTVTSVVFGTEVTRSIIPLFISGGAMWYEWIIEPPTPIVLEAGEGLCLRTAVACPATQTWQYSYCAYWSEK